ncbi:copper homeostasis protein [Breznakia sp. PF5-3]|uniref:copper homeostasis protein CutC n=1 Tax=unclassified Breznakia TaxID=2623764 RepID=UPI002404D245|nr:MULTISPECIES: copper homeostasis protein CutC [unclassified Breznakia]MDF9824275.1 copper homeostasis protein [Breznakia sp. PM6-1]MDF9835499.1 copper homeostasis protein [Breznakia sp. PF5-3]MDF9838027.1 copper homeostasis protein [Breznakia sp. PFB2-8]MDF9859405.1 copper homeostasis protein [Breznakia sp. PH5-24]
MNNLLEVCCGSFYDAFHAAQAGADRIELNSALFLGGLTPSIGSLVETKEHTNVKTICMVRPRAGGFCYDHEDQKTMFFDAKMLLDQHADGIAFGFLNEDKTIDKPATKKMIELIHSYGKEAVFHRAIDICLDIDGAIECLIKLGCDRILTSGSHANAEDGKTVLQSIQRKYGDKIEIVMGSGINERNVESLIEYTQITQVHSSCKAYKTDPTTSTKLVSYQFLNNNDYDIVSYHKVKALKNALSK